MTGAAGVRAETVRCLTSVGEEVVRTAGDRVAAPVDDVLRQLSEPLHLAVVGRVKAGKSTLVNALVGQAVAPTRPTECTQHVTTYRFGRPATAAVVLRDGRRSPLALVDGRLPEATGSDPDEVDHLDVQLPSGCLRDLVLVDTPGLGTTSTALVRATERAVLGSEAASERAAGRADALLFLFREVEHEDEVAFLRAFRAASGRLSTGAVNAVGVLTHADGAAEHDPFAAAAARAAQIGDQRTAELSAVLPVSGLLAETARAGRVGEAQARLLASLAGVSADELRLWALTGPPDGVDEGELDRLLERLGPYGLDAGRGPAAGGARGLLTWLEEVSGIARLEAVVHGRLVARAAALKAERALSALEDVAAGLPHAVRPVVEDLLDQARTDPRLHVVRELRALGVLAARRSTNTALRTELERLLEHRDDPAALGLPEVPSAAAREARRRAGAAQALVSAAATSAEEEAGHVVSRSWLLLARRSAGAVG